MLWGRDWKDEVSAVGDARGLRRGRAFANRSSSALGLRHNLLPRFLGIPLTASDDLASCCEDFAAIQTTSRRVEARARQPRIIRYLDISPSPATLVQSLHHPAPSRLDRLDDLSLTPAPNLTTLCTSLVVAPSTGTTRRETSPPPPRQPQHNATSSRPLRDPLRRLSRSRQHRSVCLREPTRSSRFNCSPSALVQGPSTSVRALLHRLRRDWDFRPRVRT